ncbi:esterase/lipase family protein [Streptosporangium sp. CA-135522]|uniref:esterase/lipase family protein n=1 Tax=Streptosporangium sp. CA-135522 TaxID=3240072 RepID=UPI003D8C6F35
MRSSRLRRLASIVIGTALVTTVLTGTANAETSPDGANDWGCEPSFFHPHPVILVHGTFENMAFNWSKLSPVLKKNGYCVFALNHGGAPDAPVQGTADIVRSAGLLSAFVDRVLQATGAAKADIVGHSQGGMMPRYYVKLLGGAAKVRKLIGIVPSNHGTTASGLVTLGRSLGLLGPVVEACPACGQQIVGSDFLRDLNAGDEALPGVEHTVIATKYDEVVTPYTSSFLNGSGVKNILLQDKCPSDTNAHLGVDFDPVVHRIVLNELGVLTAYWPVDCADPLG